MISTEESLMYRRVKVTGNDCDNGQSKSYTHDLKGTVVEENKSTQSVKVELDASGFGKPYNYRYRELTLI